MSTPRTPEKDRPTNLALEALVKLRNQLKLVQYPKTTNRHRQEAYALDAEDLSTELCAELDYLLDAMVNPHSDINCFKTQVSLETAMRRMAMLYRLLGVVKKVKQIPAEVLSLDHLVHFAPHKTALRRARNYDEVRLIEQASLEAAEQTQATLRTVLNWLRKERQIHPSTEKGVVEVFLVVAKIQHFKETDSLKADNYGDIPVILMLRQELKEAKERAKHAPPAADESLKWLDWPEFLACVHHLERECQPTYSYGSKRTPTAVARSVQRYLLFALLAYMPPDRQRTLRELEVGKTLVKGLLNHNGVFEAKDDGKWYIHLMKTNYKTGKTYGEQWLMVPDILYSYLEAWLAQWRALFSPNHNFVFTQENGKPYRKASDLSNLIRRATYRLAGKLTTSHLIRHMLITYLKRHGASDEVMRSLADAMHHSTKIQGEIYDRRHQLEKVAPAQDLVLKLAMGEPVSTLIGVRSLSVEELVQQIRQLSPGERQRLLTLVRQS
ncbi:site-specific integrase [Cyanobacteria bacterium FACHB-DQ100]|nr:site-specific integrase [Cyanobacteria bacterium FACHB-DQ100]